MPDSPAAGRRAATPAGVSRPFWPLDTGERRIQPLASYTVMRWLRSETIAMSGSPAGRDATVSIARSPRTLVAPA
jgi:hypothetical protein